MSDSGAICDIVAEIQSGIHQLLAENRKLASERDRLRGDLDRAALLLGQERERRVAAEERQALAHGREAEELRYGIEKIIEADGDDANALQQLLDRVDAGNSLYFLERLDNDLKSHILALLDLTSSDPTNEAVIAAARKAVSGE